MTTSIAIDHEPDAMSPVVRSGTGSLSLRAHQQPHPNSAGPVASGLRIGIVAPPWVPVPPPAYGGIELMVDALTRGLSRLGHHVELFTVADSTCPVNTNWLFESCPDQIGQALPELRHAAAAYRYLARRCQLIHDHTLAGPLLAAHNQLPVPVVTTNHGPFSDDLADLYRHINSRVPLISISADQASRAPADIHVGAVIHHGLDLDRYPPRLDGPSGEYVLCLARMHPSKGIDTAIEAARRAGVRLVIAAKMREPNERHYYRHVIRPLLGDHATYVGEADHTTKTNLLAGADALLNPIAWPEPFGLTMIEALACGTPVITTPNGAAPEIVTHGTTGYLATHLDDLVAALNNASRIDRRRCHSEVADRFSMHTMAANHAVFYHQIIHHGRRTSTTINGRPTPRATTRSRLADPT